MDRWLHSTLYEFNMAAEGYWRNWERKTAWLAREINWTIIQWAPFFKQDDKPKKRQDIMKLSMDQENKTKVKPQKINAEELAKMRKLLINQ